MKTTPIVTLTKGIVSCEGRPYLRFGNNLEANLHLVKMGYRFVSHIGSVFGFQKSTQSHAR